MHKRARQKHTFLQHTLVFSHQCVTVAQSHVEGPAVRGETNISFGRTTSGGMFAFLPTASQQT